MTKPRDREFMPRDAHDALTTEDPPTPQAVRRRTSSSGARFGALVGSAFGDGRVGFVVNLWADAAVFAAAAAATALSVWRQDPGRQAGAPSATRVAVHSPRSAPAWAANGTAFFSEAFRRHQRHCTDADAVDRAGG